MSTYTRDTNEGIDSELDDRDVRALTQCLTVIPDAPGLYDVVSQSGNAYTVDVETGACTCPDAEYHDPEGGCKHARRVRYETGRDPLPAWIDTDELPDDFALHVDATPTVAVTDGGSEIIHAGDDGVILEDRPPITEHRESYEQGGTRYWRCEGCGRETVHGRENIPHADGCPRADD